MIRKYYDKIILGIALLVLLIVFGYAAFRPDPKQITEYVDIPALRPENTFELSEMPEIDLEVPKWEKPPAQSAGSEWVFDVFTPPVIHFNPRSAQFIIEQEPVEVIPFGIELVGIQEELYRVQLTGHVGSEGDYLINLENEDTGEFILAREGREYPNFDIVVRSFEIERVPVKHQGTTDVYENIATAVIYDQRLDREVTLRSDERKRDEEPTAHFRATDDSGMEFRVQEGQEFELGEATYRVDEINPPRQVIVTRFGGGETGEPERRTLRASAGNAEEDEENQIGDSGGTEESPQSPDSEEEGADGPF